MNAREVLKTTAVTLTDLVVPGRFATKTHRFGKNLAIVMNNGRSQDTVEKAEFDSLKGLRYRPVLTGTLFGMYMDVISSVDIGNGLLATLDGEYDVAKKSILVAIGFRALYYVGLDKGNEYLRRGWESLRKRKQDLPEQLPWSPE